MKQPEALRLAEHIHALFVSEWGMNSPMAEDSKIVLAELRRLHAVNAELLDLMQRAIRRLEIEHAHGGSIMREWITESRAAIAKATGEQA